MSASIMTEQVKHQHPKAVGADTLKVDDLAILREEDQNQGSDVDVDERATAFSTRGWTLAVGIVALALISYSQLPVLFAEPPSQDLYSVVFDAGSTGSRVFVFHFQIKNKGHPPVRLEGEVFQSTEPGISTYSRHPPEAAVSLRPLLQRAIESVPTQIQPYTLVTFKATAGLRLLNQAKADQILNEVRKLISSSPFYLPDSSAIEIMSGEEEGLFGWVAVNFLLDLIWDEDSDNTVTTFDLGGGSVQITFEIAKTEQLANFVVKDLFKLHLGDTEINMFTKSYLGYGLKSAQLGIMGGMEGPDGKVDYDQDVSDKIDAEHVLLLSPCHAMGHNFSISQGEVDYIVKGVNPSPYILRLCKAAVDKFVLNAKFVQDNELSRREIHLFSYFFDVARWAKMIPWNEHRHILTPQDYYDAAEKYCHQDRVSNKHPFLCMNLLYIHALLTDGAGLAADKELNVESQLLGREVSWTLGAALSTLSNKFYYSSIYL